MPKRPKRPKVLTLVHVPPLSKNKDEKAKKPYVRKPPPQPLDKPPVPIQEVLDYFKKAYPDAACGLRFNNPYELLMATILSAQCTDSRVNTVTEKLFQVFPTVESMADAELSEVEELVKTCGFYHTKSVNMHKTARIITLACDGKVPRSFGQLLSLPGVGPKTANVLLGNAFHTPALTVDTHLGRLSRRMGLSIQRNPELVEKDLMKLVPKNLWTRFSHQAISHGRAVCKSRNPRCQTCGLENCPSRPEIEPQPDQK
ncbi:MAG: endonuclease III [Deltaproteobacteria bacterium]|jgi:endonuclease-3|nr:endonuclease III [Deltaproteobacteria bacterium]